MIINKINNQSRTTWKQHERGLIRVSLKLLSGEEGQRVIFVAVKSL